MQWEYLVIERTLDSGDLGKLGAEGWSLAFANLEATLQAGGCGLDDIVDVMTFHTDPENQFGTIMAVKSEVFPAAPYPNWTAIGVNWLAGFDFEIKVIARIPG